MQKYSKRPGTIELFCILLTIAISGIFSTPAYTYGLTEESSVWTIKVNERLKNTSPPVYGLWCPSPGSTSELFFGIFDDHSVLEKALSAIRKLDPEAQPKSVPRTVTPYFIPFTQRINFPDIGHHIPLQIRGVRGQAGIHIPWSKALPIKEVRAVFDMKYPEGIFQKPSTLTIYVENTPVKALSLDQPITSPVNFSMKIPKYLDIGDFLDIYFVTSITITGDICADEQTGNAWVIVEPSSFFEISYIPNLKDTLDILRNPANRLNVIPSGKPGLDELTGIVNLANLAGALNPYGRERIVTFGERYSPFSPNIIVKQGEEDGKIVGRDIIASPKGLIALAKMLAHFPLSLYRWKKTVTGTDPKKNEFTVTLSDIGVSPSLLRGVGELRFSIPFTTASFGGLPSRLIMTLIYSHTPVEKDERAYLKARLNNVLIASKFITGSAAEESFSFELPSRLLQTRNSLDIAFSYFTNRGECRGSFPEIEVSLLPDSFFTVVGHNLSEPQKFDRFPGFLEKDGIMILGTSDSALIDVAIALSEKLGKIRGAPFFVNVVGFDQFSPKDPVPSFLIAVIKASQSGIFKPPIDLSENFLIQNPQTGQVSLKVETTDKVAVWEVFQNELNKPVGLFAISDSLVDSETAGILVEDLRIEGSANAAVRIVSGDLSSDKLATLGAPWRFFEIGEKMKVITPTKKGFSYYWARYRIIFFGFMAAGLFVFLWYVYRKLT